MCSILPLYMYILHYHYISVYRPALAKSLVPGGMLNDSSYDQPWDTVLELVEDEREGGGGGEEGFIGRYDEEIAWPPLDSGYKTLRLGGRDTDRREIRLNLSHAPPFTLTTVALSPSVGQQHYQYDNQRVPMATALSPSRPHSNSIVTMITLVSP